MPEEINYAIGGTVNYVTLQPTLNLKPSSSSVRTTTAASTR